MILELLIRIFYFGRFESVVTGTVCCYVMIFFTTLVSSRWYVRRCESVVIVCPIRLLCEKHFRNRHVNLYTILVLLRNVLGGVVVLFLTISSRFYICSAILLV